MQGSEATLARGTVVVAVEPGYKLGASSGILPLGPAAAGVEVGCMTVQHWAGLQAFRVPCPFDSMEAYSLILEVPGVNWTRSVPTYQTGT